MKSADLLSDGGKDKNRRQIPLGKLPAQNLNLYKGWKGAIYNKNLSLSKTADPACKLSFIPSQVDAEQPNNFFQLCEHLLVFHDSSAEQV
ncbi:hypothetical protein MYX84_05990 [Acidobacteria bacterium AH-259-O06]|nr:hypothetical protein [Acidobacteria bacterium AH-259-O06]